MTIDLHSLRAADLMTRDVHWAAEHESLRTAARRMEEQGVRALLVRGRDEHDLPGILTTKDVVNLLGAHDVAVLDDTTVGDVMTRPALCVPKQANVVDCIHLMRMNGVRRMPVLDGTAVIGVLSTSDVFARALRG